MESLLDSLTAGPILLLISGLGILVLIDKFLRTKYKKDK